MRAAILVAGGTGSRFGNAGGKQLASLLDRPVVGWSLRALGSVASLGLVVIVCHPDLVREFESLASKPLASGASVVVVPGGDTRRASVYEGLSAVPAEAATVLVHDGARPLAAPALFESVMGFLDDSRADGVVVGYPAVDTIKRVAGGRVLETPDRSTLWAIQTPQAFRTSALRSAHETALADGFEGTDDASLVERAGGKVLVFEGPRDNIKITMPDDVVFAEAVLRRGATGEDKT